MPCERQVMRDELLLKLFQALRRRAVWSGMCGEYREKVLEDLQRYKEVETAAGHCAEGESGAAVLQLTLRQGLMTAEALLRWSDETLEELKRLDEETVKEEGNGPETGTEGSQASC